jgi:NO-binding membrane sensor protein with MHYT domain
VIEIDRVQVVAIVVSVVLLMVVLELVRRRKLVEEYSLLWIVGSLAILGLSIWRGVLDLAARQLGVYYPPSLLLMLLVVSVFIALLWFSVVLSRQRTQIDRLMEETAILGAEIRDLRSRDAGAPADRMSVP